MATTFKLFADKMGGSNTADYIGKPGEIFYDPTTTSLRISDGSTPGGFVVSGGSGAGDLTSVASNIIPSTDDTYSLGSPEKRWADIHLGPGTIYIEDTADPDITAELTVTNGVLQINGADQLQVVAVTADTITFDRTVTGVTAAKGQLVWNGSDGTLDLGIGYDDVVLQIGQETHYVVRNATGSTILNGTAVYCSGVTVGSGRMEATPFVADNTVDSTFFLGLATHDITNGVNGVVTYFGYVRGLDTRGTANTSISVGDENWSVGDKLYAHPTVAGKLTNVEPTLPDQKICVASVINRHQSSGVLFVRPSQHIPTAAGDLTDSIKLSDLKTLVAASTDFADFQSRIAAL